MMLHRRWWSRRWTHNPRSGIFARRAAF